MKSTHPFIILLCLSVICFAAACEKKEVVIETADIVVLIESPSNHHFAQGKVIEFAGSGATDAGELPDSELTWTSSIDGVIGTGTLFTRDDLSPGTHEIELSAVNKNGETFFDSTTIEIYKRRDRRDSADAGRGKAWFRRIKDPVDGGLYILVHDGTVVDMSTGLMWETSPDNAKRNFQGAVTYAKKLRLGGHKGWRVPTVNELRMISNIYFSPEHRRMLNISEKAVVRNAAISNVFETMNGHFWAVDPSKPYVVIANKRYGHTIRYESDSSVSHFRATYMPYLFNKPGYVRCVRNADLNKWRKILAKSK